ncbi:GNAT family N-acetyltransferase [Paenibacillus sp. PR3]|uniref:GNAT family N-acetyltransferase n=1 Tax=Paenibacillus terricola TaxID=2763503 RepID=A0ABR8N260_9BACL|nr:GNAT family N-acetyltransferase [Paenibacillus terricola]MBD3922268.1 GNAT family N-acetyltransferase [Paenibacillus terricola]
MNIYLEEVTINEEHILLNLFEYYDYEFSPYLNFEVNQDGLFRKAPVHKYLSDEKYNAYFIKSEETLLGFVIVTMTNNELNKSAFEMEQFFVLKKYSGKGVGKQAAMIIFDRHRGDWKVTQVERNYPAQAFWRSVIKTYTSNSYSETYDEKRRSIQEFNNA